MSGKWKPPPEHLDKPERTVPVEIKGTNAKTGRSQVVAVTVRRVSDARLWESFTADEEWAAEQIRTAFASIDRGLGVKPVSTEARVSGGKLSYGPAFTDAVQAYFTWASECVRRRIDHSAVMDVLGYGKSCRETDTRRRKRKGYTREQIALALALFLAQNGRPARSIVA